MVIEIQKYSRKKREGIGKIIDVFYMEIFLFMFWFCLYINYQSYQALYLTSMHFIVCKSCLFFLTVEEKDISKTMYTKVVW
jgi:hypothetical protein